jgi:phospholipase C
MRRPVFQAVCFSLIGFFTLTLAGCSLFGGNSPKPTVTISANPTTINAGGSSTLTVAASNAGQIAITGSDGTSFTLQAAGGTQAVTPTSSTTYTATATGGGVKVTATATVTVNPLPGPTVTIGANPTTITDGQSTTLTVTATNATGVTVTGSDNTTYTLAATGGTQTVSPTTTTTYTATATGNGGSATATATVTVNPAQGPTVTISANPPSINVGQSTTLTVTATNATAVTVTGTDKSSYTLSATGGTQAVSPTTTTTYTATATGTGGSNTATVTVTVTATLQSIQHVIFMLQENHSFDNYFGMLNPYRQANGYNIGDDGVDYEVDGIDDKTSTISNVDNEGTSYNLFKFKTTCVDDMSSDWLSSYGDVNRYDFLTTRPINMDGFVHNGEGYAKSCAAANSCSGSFTDLTGQRAMGYYDQDYLNYYYYMASQFAVSDRWFSPVSSKSVDNRIATFSGGTTQGLVKDPGNDHVGQLSIPTIFQDLDQNHVSWKIYYTVTEGLCQSDEDCGTGSALYPATDFLEFAYSQKYLHKPAADGSCAAPTQPSSVVGDSTNSFCIDPTHIAPLNDPEPGLNNDYKTDLQNGTLPSFAFIEAGYGHSDEHPGSEQTILDGQAAVATIVNSLMQSSSWPTSAFFFSYDEGGGPYDHVPPVPGHSNDNTTPSTATYPDISSIAVNPDTYFPCVGAGGTPSLHCDLSSTDPGATPGDAPQVNGFAAQLGFRVPNFVVSPYSRRHYVSHIPMDHTAVIRFVENLFIPNNTPLTGRDAVQPNLLDFFDFTNMPWITPPSTPAPTTKTTLGFNPCTPTSM